LRIKPKMIGIYTAGIIASVTDNHAVGDFALMMKLPGETMCAICLALVRDFAVPLGVYVSIPFPAFVKTRRDETRTKDLLQRCSIQVGPARTLFLWGMRGGGMLRHVNASLLGVGRARGCYQQRPGVLFPKSIIPQVGDSTQRGGVDRYAPLLEAAWRKRAANA
jgi:hypothetical protein